MSARRQVPIGERFGRLVVIGAGESTRAGQSTWLCVCDCGEHREVMPGHLERGTQKSCGCFKAERSRTWMVERGAEGRTTHGLSRRPEYRVWASMIQRCHNERDPSYHWYGGRGILVCQDWRQSFEAFYRDMGPRPDPSLSIDRIDNDGNYGPGNCRWATKSQQNLNRRTKETAA